MSYYTYSVRMAPTAITTSKTLVQVKTGAAPVDIISVRLYQVTKTSSELWNLQLIQWTAAPTFATVTTTTPNPLNPLDPAALAVGSNVATGVNASAEPSGGTSQILEETDWNILNGEWLYLPPPEARIRAKQGGLGFTFKLNTAPAASTTVGAIVVLGEYQ